MNKEIPNSFKMTSSRKCNIALCTGPNNCLALGMINGALNEDDLNQTFTTIATKCHKANQPELIKAYIKKLTMFQE